MIRNTLTALVLLVAVTVPLRAQESDGNRPLGTWTHTVVVDDHQAKVRLEVKGDSIHCVIRTTEGPAVNTITLDADYIVTSDKLLVGVLPAAKKPQKGEAKNEERVFLCRFTVEKNTLVVTDVTSGGGSNEQVKKVFEGKYHRAGDRTGAAKREAPKVERVPYQSSSY